MVAVSPKQPKSDEVLLALLGITLPPLEVHRPLVLWKSNEAAFSIFCRIAEHGQWLRNPVDPNQILSIDGSYLINYLKATQAGDIAELIDEVYLVVRGWLAARSDDSR